MTGDGAGQTVLDRLLDVLILYGLRVGLGKSEAPPPWVRAASEPRLSAALTAIHADPARAWTVDELAGVSNMSRATFARVFGDILGQAPIRYGGVQRLSSSACPPRQRRSNRQNSRAVGGRSGPP